MSWLIAVGLGVLIGLALGALGGGGSILTVPVLVYLLGQSPQEATSSSLVIVGVTSIISAVHHARSGRVHWRIGIGFAAAGIVASIAGTALNANVNGTIILLAFAAVMVISSVSMLWRTRGHGSARRDPGGNTTPETAGHESRASDLAQRSLSAPSLCARAVRVVVAGLVVGFLTGFLGVGGGFVIVPALIAALGFAMPAAVGTSLLIIALNSAVSLAARTGSNHFDWAIIIPFTLAAILGSFVGKAIADRLPAQRMTRIFALLLLAVAAYIVIESI